MDFDDDARLDASQVEDARGLPIGGMALGGGTIGVIALIAALVFDVDPSQILGGESGESGSAPPANSLSSKCRTGADADQSEDCRIVGVVNSVQAYWKQEFADSGRTYPVARTRLFSGATSTACGNATSAVGPFYCPGDKRVYLDLGFFEELHAKFGAKGGPFAQAYVVAHEYGHHVQDVLGTMRKVGDDRQGASSASVRLELQADCYSGVWAKHAVRTGFFNKPFTDRDIAEALDAAQAVGDDRIQERARGRVDPESFTHGTAEQRKRWFSTGYATGEPSRCETFAGGI
ncbi:neutral zinc metallopeptidase [Actinomadura sp. HBU206391]|uniref:KPN_02809 family neutral zinc metallopeptidase n=1 Tax=Actinomadura sp. HBU206391 TaxID=2731692 RepID=UPI0016501AE8|nr:neutral zinc metallopeptidase [Actinomadura sp. HBU206391]MBC6460753.1 zinc metallopeptidase [Actinomadura sp. HBU206391]